MSYEDKTHVLGIKMPHLTRCVPGRDLTEYVSPDRKTGLRLKPSIINRVYGLEFERDWNHITGGPLPFLTMTRYSSKTYKSWLHFTESPNVLLFAVGNSGRRKNFLDWIYKVSQNGEASKGRMAGAYFSISIKGYFRTSDCFVLSSHYWLLPTRSIQPKMQSLSTLTFLTFAVNVRSSWRSVLFFCKKRVWECVLMRCSKTLTQRSTCKSSVYCKFETLPLTTHFQLGKSRAKMFTRFSEQLGTMCQ